MDMFVVSMAVGSMGLLSMAVGGLRHQGHGHHGHGHGQVVTGRGGHVSHGIGSSRGHGHAGTLGRGGNHSVHHHGHLGQAAGQHHATQNAAGNGAGHAAAADGAGHAAADGSVHTGVLHGSILHGATWLLGTPRILFSVLLGLGATGLALDSVLHGWPLIGAAVAGGIVFERLIITPIWNFAMRFASKPALTLESALMDEAVAVTSFNRDGEGIIAIELDGQVIQVLARLRRDDRALGAGVRVGQRVRIEEVNAANNRCTVSVL